MRLSRRLRKSRSEMENEMRRRRVYCYYHRIDLDGHCSAAIVCRWAEKQGYEFVGIPVDYSDGLEPFETLPDIQHLDIGVMVDFCAPTVDIMVDLEFRFFRFMWIDHHKSAIEMMEKETHRFRAGLELEGLRRVGDAACELCLEYFFPGEKNEVVSLLGRYDVWDKDNANWEWETQIVPFQLAMRMNMKATLEDDEIPWHVLFNDTFDLNSYVDVITSIGRSLYRYDKSLRETDQQHAYRCVWNGIKCVCINSSLRGSGTLESICEPDEMMVVWRFDGNQWIVGLYSHAESDIDCGAIASKHGGGGHKNAAGFRIEEAYSPLYQFQTPGRLKQMAEFANTCLQRP